MVPIDRSIDVAIDAHAPTIETARPGSARHWSSRSSLTSASAVSHAVMNGAKRRQRARGPWCRLRNEKVVAADGARDPEGNTDGATRREEVREACAGGPPEWKSQGTCASGLPRNLGGPARSATSGTAR